MKSHETIILIAIAVGTIVGGVIVIAALSQNSAEKKADQATYLQECLERTTDKDWCYIKVFDLDLDLGDARK